MKTLMVWLACSLLTFYLHGFGQTSPSDSPMTSGTTAKSDTMKTIVGCISERGDKIVLINKKYPAGVELRMSQDLKRHVGLQAKVTGTIVPSVGMNGGPKSDNMKSDSHNNMDNKSRDQMMKRGEMAMEVDHVLLDSGPIGAAREPFKISVLVRRSRARVLHPWLAASRMYRNRAASLSTLRRMR